MTTSPQPHFLRARGVMATRGTLHQTRVQLYLKILTFFFVAFVALGIVKYVALYQRGMHHWLDAVRSGTLLFAFLTTLLVGAWLGVRNRAPSDSILQWVDSAGTIVAGGILATILPLVPIGTNEFALAFLLILMFVVRASIVPSTGTRTFVVGTLGTIPLAVGLWIRGADADVSSAAMVAFAGPVVAVWGFVFAIATAVISRVIYGLQKELWALGSYRLVERLGTGGMGDVWRAEHQMLARPAAIKMIRADTLGGGMRHDAAVERFAQEAQATAALTSPNTIHLYDFGQADDGSFYYVMELLCGLDLQSLVAQHGPQPAARVVHFLVQICASLHEAHAAGLIHRDIKPANVFVCRYGGHADFIKVLDFGLVKHQVDDVESGITRDGIAVGTPAFMAPESFMSKGELDARADLYAVGCVAYWLLTGMQVFQAKTPTALLAQHATEMPIPPSQRTELDVPAALEALILACLEKDRGKRPASAQQLRNALANLDLCWTDQSAEAWWQEHRPEPP